MTEELKHFSSEIIRELELRHFKITDELEANKININCVMGGISIGLLEAIDFIRETVDDWNKRVEQE